MKIKLFKEHKNIKLFSKIDDYNIISKLIRIFYNKDYSNNLNTENFSTYEIEKITKLFKNKTIYTTNIDGNIIDHKNPNTDIINISLFKKSVMTYPYTNFSIVKTYDEWYYVCYHRSNPNGSMIYNKGGIGDFYICDSFDGLLQFLNTKIYW